MEEIEDWRLCGFIEWKKQSRSIPRANWLFSHQKNNKGWNQEQGTQKVKVKRKGKKTIKIKRKGKGNSQKVNARSQKQNYQ